MKKARNALPVERLPAAKNSVLLETLRVDNDNFRSFLFSDPLTVLETRKLAEVEEMLAKIDEFVSAGYYLAGFISYEAGYAFLPRLGKLIRENQAAPLLWLGVYKNPCILDHRLRPVHKTPPLAARGQNYWLGRIKRQVNRDAYREQVRKVKDYIGRGETYQINYTWNVHFPFRGSAFSLYNDLKRVQPVSYAAYIDTGELQILSFSPELFFRRTADKLTVKPMKGTGRRGLGPKQEQILRQRLHASEKDRAENLMIVDLLRNDLGRIALPGSVAVKSLFEIESYETLLQMTSTVQGTLKQGTGYAEIFKSLFPCGSVTGAPKIRSMEIIKEIEYNARGIYTGCIGYIAPDNQAVFNVAIRTPVIRRENGSMGIGSGIVWDSDPEQEYKECLLKMKFFNAAGPDFQIYESMLWEKGEYFLQSFHLERMKRSAAYFSFAFREKDFLDKLAETALVLVQGKAHKVRIFAHKNGKLSVDSREIAERPEKEPRIALSRQKVNSENIFLYHKTTRREMYDEASELARARGLWDVVFQNERGEITEGCRSNIFIKEGEKLLTPPVACGILPGTLRRYILETDPGAREEIITPERLAAAKQVFMGNSVRKLVEVSLAEEPV